MTGILQSLQAAAKQSGSTVELQTPRGSDVYTE